MNERIKELVRQAGIYQPDRFDAIDGSNQMEKFAELIVRECMKLNRDILCEDDPDYLDKVYKEHFGV